MLDESDDIHPLFHGAPASTGFRKLRKRIMRHTREAAEQHPPFYTAYTAG
jgi:tRNA 2-thiocytidine biosynthesis protein TtcA